MKSLRDCLPPSGKIMVSPQKVHPSSASFFAVGFRLHGYNYRCKVFFKKRFLYQALPLALNYKNIRSIQLVLSQIEVISNMLVFEHQNSSKPYVCEYMGGVYCICFLSVSCVILSLYGGYRLYELCIIFIPVRPPPAP